MGKSKHQEPDRKARPWVTAVVVSPPAHQVGAYLVGYHHDHGWVFPGGRVNPFERLHEAAVREFKEETGLDVEVMRQLRAFEVIYRKADHHSIVVAYSGRVVGGKLKAADDIGQLRSMTLSQLRKDEDTADITLRIISELLGD